MDKILRNIIASNTIAKGDSVIIGFSGGPDSLTLLYALNSMKSAYSLSLYAVHVNHRIRPGDCEAEAKHAKDICDKLRVPFELRVYDCRAIALRERISEEEAGRHVRYESFAEAAKAVEAGGVDRDRIKIAVAQNADDQVETVLFHILRGTTVHGLAGIAKVRLDEHGYKVVRPLLATPRSDIEEYISEKALEPNIDESNEKPIYSRNKIRLELIPDLEKKFNPSLRKSIIRLSETAACDDDYMMQAAEDAFARVKVNTAIADDVCEGKGRTCNDNEHELEADDKCEVHYRIGPLIGMHAAVKRRVAAVILEENDIHPTYDLVNAIVSIVESDSPSASCSLPGGVIAERRYGELVLTDRQPQADVKALTKGKDVPIPTPFILSAEEYRKKVSNVKREDIGQEAVIPMRFASFDLDKLAESRGVIIDEPCDGMELLSKLSIRLRTRRPADYISVGKGNKKLQDFLVDEKVPKSARDTVDFIACGDEILWILPRDDFKSERYRMRGKYSQKYQIDDNSKRVLFLELF